jgi:hypothetical protein
MALSGNLRVLCPSSLFRAELDYIPGTSLYGTSIFQDRGSRNLLVYVDDFSAVVSTRHGFFFQAFSKMSSATSFAHGAASRDAKGR